MESFDQFEQKVLSEGRIDFDGVYGYQCVDLILQYAYDCFGIRGERGNAIDYWNNPSQIIFTKFDKIPTQNVERGDIVVLNGLAGNPFGHVMLATGSINGDAFEGIEQNGSTGSGTGEGGDAVRKRYVAKVRIAGVLRPQVTAPPAPTPPVPTSAEGTYNVVVAIPGFGDSAHAANHESQADMVQPGNYHVFNQANGMINVTSTPDVPGSWINPADNITASPSPASANYDGNSITIQPGWGLSNAAQAAGYGDSNLPTRWAAIAELNGSDDWQNFNAALKAGQRIIVGTSAAQPPIQPPSLPVAPQQIEYKKLDSHITFVTKLNPTHVWKLDYMDESHAESSYDMPVDAPFVAFGQAQRIDLADKPVYFMTEADFGEADQTGVAANSRGINTADLKTAPTEVASIPSQVDTSTQIEDVGEKIPVKVLSQNLDVRFNYLAFLSPQKYTAVKLDTHIKELQELNDAGGLSIHPDQQLIPTQDVLIAGTLGVNREYYRTVKSVESGLYYAIPKGDLVREDDITDEEFKSLMKDANEFIVASEAQSKKMLKTAAGLEGFFARLFHRNKK